jgi:hypothetical protein
MTLGIFVRLNNALKICDKKIKQPNAIIDVDTDIYPFFSVAKIHKIIVIVRKQVNVLSFFINFIHVKFNYKKNSHNKI